MKIKTIINLLSIALLITLITSCEEEVNIKGCIDPVSLSFNPAATEDDGSCTYERDLFLGNYTGNINCPNDTTFSALTIMLNIKKSLDRTDGVEIFYNASEDGKSFESWFIFEGTVSGNEITLLDNREGSALFGEVTFRNILYPNPIISADGKGTLEGDILTFPRFTINVYEEDEKVAGLNCSFEGKR